MKKKVIGFAAVGLLLSTVALAQEVPQTTAPVYNCDFQPSCEVAPGIYGKMATPVTSKFKMSIGGFVKLDYVYNSVNLGASGAVTPPNGNIPKSSSLQGMANQSIFTARQSRLWFKVDGPAFMGAKTSALIEADFYGDPSAAAESPQLRMRQAWGSLEWPTTQLLFGQTWDIFGPMAMATIDFRQGAPWGTPNNPRLPQIRLTQKVNLNNDNALKLVLGLQDPNQNGNNNANVPTLVPAAVNVLTPMGQLATAPGTFGSGVNVAAQVMLVSKALGVGPGFWGLSMNSLTAGFFGLYGSQSVVLASGAKSVPSWGYGFYTFVPILSSKDGRSRDMTLSFEGQAYMAANMQFNTATATSFVGRVNNPQAAKGYGYAGQLIFFPTQNLGITAGYGQRHVYNPSDYGDYRVAGSSYVPNYQRSNSLIFANVSYDLNAAVRLAAEYENVTTRYGNPVSVVNSPSLFGTSSVGTANIARMSFFYFF